MLVGEEDCHQGLLQAAPQVFACLAKALADRALVRQDAANALAQASLQPFLAHLTGQQLAWLQRHMQLTAESCAQVIHMGCDSAGSIGNMCVTSLLRHMAIHRGFGFGRQFTWALILAAKRPTLLL